MSDRERRVLESMERELRRTDPRFVRQFARLGKRRMTGPSMLLALGLLVMVLGSAIVSVPVAMFGIGIAVRRARRRLLPPRSASGSPAAPTARVNVSTHGGRADAPVHVDDLRGDVGARRRAPARSTSGRASPTPTGRRRCSPTPQPTSRAASTSTRPGPASRRCAPPWPSTSAGSTASPSTPTTCWSPRAPPRPSRPRCWGCASRATRSSRSSRTTTPTPPRSRSRARCCRPVPLRPPTFAFDPDELRAAFSPRTKLVLVNTPHNPTGTVLHRRRSSATIGALAAEYGAVVVTDEVYEHMTLRRAPARPDGDACRAWPSAR